MGSARASGWQPTNFAPRVGIAYDVRGDAKTVIRANYGFFYDRAPGNLQAQSSVFNSTTVPLVILGGGSPCAVTSPNAAASPLNLNATNAFQGSLGNPNCLGASAAGVNYIASQQRFDPNNSNSVFVNQNFLAAGFPLAILPSGLPADLHYVTPYVQQISFGIETDLGHDMSLNVAYNSTGGRHLNRPVNVNPVNPQLLTANWRNAVNAVKAGTAAPGTAGRNVESVDGGNRGWGQSLRRRSYGTIRDSGSIELLPQVGAQYVAGELSRESECWRWSMCCSGQRDCCDGWAWRWHSGSVRRYDAESYDRHVEL